MTEVIALTSKEDEQRKTNALTEKQQNFFDEIRATVTSRQFRVLEKLFEIEKIPKTIVELTEILGVARVTWYSWLKDPSFRGALYMVSRARFAIDDPFVNQVLADKARDGELGAIRLLKELCGQLTPQKKQEAHNQIQINYNDPNKVG